MLAEGMSISNKSLISYISVRRNTIEHLNKYFILVPLIGLCFRLTNHRISAQQKADNRCASLKAPRLMLTNITFNKAEFERDLGTHEILYSILKECYVDPGIALRYAIEEADTLYCAYYSSVLVGFFFHRWQPDYVELNGETLSISRMILGAVDHSHKNNGIFKYMLERIQEDLTTKYKDIHYHALYGRTGSILAFKGLAKVFPNIEPSANGNYSHDGFALAEQISQTYFLTSFTDKRNPFSLKNTTKHILADAERDILKRELKKVSNNIFEEFHIDEKNGDRLLYIINTKSLL